MAVTAHIEWPGVPGSLGYQIEYKEQSSAVWLTPGPPTNPANPTLNLFYDLEIEEGIIYDLRLASICPDGVLKYRYTTLYDAASPTYGWIEDTFTCEQDVPFTLLDTYTGFSSPQGIFWDQTSSRFYVVDVDDINSNVYHFNPATFTGFSDIVYALGTNAPVGITSASHAHDAARRRIWISGDDSGGARVLDIASGNWTFLPYGTNAPGGAARRSPIVLSNDTAYCFCSLPDTIETFDLTTLASTGSILKSGIPSASTYMTDAYGVTFVGSEAWVWAGSRGNGSIAVYNNDFTSLITTITLPGIVPPGAPWSPNPGLFWQSHLYNEATNRWYVGDTGSNSIIVINTLTKAIVNNFTITNLRGKDHASTAFFKNELTGDIFAAVRCLNSAGDLTPNSKLYRIDDTGIVYTYPDESVAQLRLRAGTNEAFGVQQNLVKWQGGAWATDGQVFKYNLS